MPKVTIDGQEVNVPAGTVVVEAARQVGNEIPVFCYHPKLAPVGMCRMCLVEVGTPRLNKDRQVELDVDGKPIINWMPKFQTGCTQVVSEGMAIRTQTSQVAAARKDVLEFLLTSHPLDCPVCDKGGECPLQNLTMAYGPGVSRFDYAVKFHFQKPVHLNNLITLDRERCIQCARCTRFSDEIAGDPVLGFENRGRGMEIVTLSDPPFDSKFSGNTTDICPVGALTTRDFRFRARVWELEDVPSICNHCAVGCNTIIGQRVNDIKRIMPRQNESVNEIWLCDKGRFAHHFANSRQSTLGPPVPSGTHRLETPLIRRGGPQGDRLVPASWPEALKLVAEKLSAAGPDGVYGISGDRLPNEDMYLFQKFFRQVLGSNHLARWPVVARGPVTGTLFQEIGLSSGSNFGKMGKDTSILVVGADAEEEAPIHFLRIKQAGDRGAALIVANPYHTKLEKYGRHCFVYRPGSAAAFVWGLVRAIMDAGLEQKEFLGSRATGLAELQTGMEQYTVARAAELAGVKAEDLQAAAQTFAQAANGVLVIGRELLGSDTDPALPEAIRALLTVTGHIGKAQNGLLPLLPHNNTQGALDMGLDAGPEYRTKWLPGYQPVTDKGTSSGIPASSAIYVIGSDLGSESDLARQALEAAPFVIVQDLLLTETALLADVVLPAAAPMEREGTFTSSERRVQRFKPALQPPGHALPDWWILRELAQVMANAQDKTGWRYDTPADIMAEIAHVVPQYATMAYENLPVPDLPSRKLDYDDSLFYRGTSFLNPGGEGQVWPVKAEDSAVVLQVRWVEPAVAGQPAAGQTWLITRPHLYDAGTLLSQTALLQPQMVPHTWLHVSPADAARWGVAEGAAVSVSTGEDMLSFVVHLDADLPAGIVTAAPARLEGAAGQTRWPVNVTVVNAQRLAS
ncbi:MAG: NADH dehydrogenase (quinone) subunit G [Chloroflexi bacterium]|nr:NADH dehydrogenase (quinone) subunit G [Chloroflexota bacterium]